MPALRASHSAQNDVAVTPQCEPAPRLRHTQPPSFSWLTTSEPVSVRMRLPSRLSSVGLALALRANSSALTAANKSLPVKPPMRGGGLIQYRRLLPPLAHGVMALPSAISMTDCFMLGPTVIVIHCEPSRRSAGSATFAVASPLATPPCCAENSSPHGRTGYVRANVSAWSSPAVAVSSNRTEGLIGILIASSNTSAPFCLATFTVALRSASTWSNASPPSNRSVSVTSPS